MRVLFAICLWFASQADAQITVTDDFNRTLSLSAPAERILSLGPHITENLFSAGAGDKVAGVVEYSDYPPEAQKIQSLGGGYGAINLEAVLALSPDLVVAWQTANNRESVEQIAAWGYPVYYSEPRTFEDIIENIEELALLAGSTDRIHPPVAALRAELQQVRAGFGAKPVQTVFYQIWDNPLITLNGDHYLSRVLELCGARNVFADLPIIAPRVSVEAVIRANPDIIIASSVDGRAPDMSSWKRWNSLKAAAARDAFLFIDGSVMHRHTARMIMGIRGLCEEIDGVRRQGSRGEWGDRDKRDKQSERGK